MNAREKLSKLFAGLMAATFQEGVEKAEQDASRMTAAYRNEVLDEVAAKLLSMGTPEDEGVHGVWETAILTVSGMKTDV